MIENTSLTTQGSAVASMLERWLTGVEQYASTTEDGFAWFGAGFPGWGIQTVHTYLAAATVVGEHGSSTEVRGWAHERALAALRYVIHTHRVGTRATTDGRPWDSSWISVLGPERAAFAVDLLHEDLDPTDQDLLRRVRIAEADWLTDHHVRGKYEGIQADRWNSSGKNWPESNIWTGSHLWRVAQAYPDAPRGEDYRARAVDFLLNGVSVAGDATVADVLDGRRVSEAHRGANFFDTFALDHHGYLNLGYMVICASNVGIAHADFVRNGWEVPESLHWHQRELWERIRPCIGPDGRLVRIGGDARIRYAYCQEYLLPALVYAERFHRDPEAAQLAEAVIGLAATEQAENTDGSFFGHRLRGLAARQPYYYTRIEGDRALALAWWLQNAGQSAPRVSEALEESAGTESARPVVELGRTAEWSDPDHGFAMVRGPRRFASFSWRASSLTQTLVLPTDRPDLAEWAMNLAPVLQWEGATPPASLSESSSTHRQVVGYQLETFAGGFATIARIHEGLDLSISEGWRSPTDRPAAITTLAVVALPDDATVVGLQLTRIGDFHPPLIGAAGLNLLIPDDVYNQHRRTIVETPTETGAGLRIDDLLDVRVTGMLTVHSRTVDDDPALRSIGVRQIVADPRTGAFFARPHDVVVDTPWAIRVVDGQDSPFELERRCPADGVHELQVRTANGEHRVTIDLNDTSVPPTYGPTPLGRITMATRPV